MASFDYGRMQGTATRLMKRFAQGSVQLKRVTTADPDPATPWIPGAETTTLYDLSATVKRVDQRYENGVLIVQTGDIVTFAVTARLIEQGGVPVDPPQTVSIEAAMSDTLIIDGVERVMTSLRPTPAAGAVVAWKAFVAV